MIKKRLKYPYLILFVFALVILPVLTISNYVSTNLELEEETPDFVTNTTVEDSLPVVNLTTSVINPYLDQSVTILNDYYEFDGEENQQINSIIEHDNTYIQNNGIDYTSENTFDVVSILEGTVENVKKDDTVGNSIEIKHNNGYVSIYESLSEVNVQKGDAVSQGQVIGRSGTNDLEKKNHLHFEIYNNGQSINPKNFLNTEVPLEQGN